MLIIQASLESVNANKRNKKTTLTTKFHNKSKKPHIESVNKRSFQSIEFNKITFNASPCENKTRFRGLAMQELTNLRKREE